jgi:uncharacterized protein YhaN
MRIHSVELRHVRQIKEVSLDLSAPLTIIGGPNGVGKTTLQQAILAAMFFTDKKLRDSFVSEFDPDSAPTAVLGLSHGDDVAAITLTRCLTDDKGEWCEGATVLKRKRLALEKIQELLPISADAAALLLWGRQDDMSRVIEAFPADGHTLLTAASVKGSGPDPKDIIAELDREFENARKGEKGGQVVGALTQARKRFELLKTEWRRATDAAEQLRNLKNELQEAMRERDQVTQDARASDKNVTQLETLERLLAAALQDDATHAQLLKQQSAWTASEKELVLARQSISRLEAELLQLQSQYRLARDAELQTAISKVIDQIKIGEKLEGECAQLEKDLKSVKRPDPADIRSLDELLRTTGDVQARIEATGVRYKLTAGGKSRTLHLAEDGKTQKELALAPGQVHSGIVGHLEFEIDDLHFTAAGKEDIAALKDAAEKTMVQTQNLFATFQVQDEAAFRALAREKQQLQDTVKEKRPDLQIKLAGSTVAELRSQLQRLQAARKENNMSLKDQEAWAGKNLQSAEKLDRLCSTKNGSLETEQVNLANLEKKQPGAEEKNLHSQKLQEARDKAATSARAFIAADPEQRATTKELAELLQRQLSKAREDKRRIDEAVLVAEKTVSNLSGQLRQTQPHRPLATIQSDLEEAKDSFNYEQVLQDARAILKERIEEKTETLGSLVPLELAKRVTQQLDRLAGGPFHEVVLAQELTVSHITEKNARKNWQPRQLSHGERHQTALAVKIAVARALAETSGPVFILLDDSLVAFDPERRAATEELLLEQVADEKLQIVLLTCHTDWAADWIARSPDQVRYIELAVSAQYYRDPPAMARQRAAACD